MVSCCRRRAAQPAAFVTVMKERSRDFNRDLKNLTSLDQTLRSANIWVVHAKKNAPGPEPKGCVLEGDYELFDRYRLRQIARLVDISAARQCGVIGEQLQRHHVQYRRQQTVMLRHTDNVQTVIRGDA